MAGSPRYLQLMDNYALIERPLLLGKRTAYTLLDQSWKEIEASKGQDTTLLRIAALNAMYCLMAEDPTLTAEQFIADAKKLHIEKNAGYAGADNPDPWANFRMCEAFGISAYDGVLVRLSDKYIRITNLRRDPTNDRVGEAITDTLRDFFAYCNIGDCIKEETA